MEVCLPGLRVLAFIYARAIFGAEERIDGGSHSLSHVECTERMSLFLQARRHVYPGLATLRYILRVTIS